MTGRNWIEHDQGLLRYNQNGKTLYACPLPAVARMMELSEGCFPITQSPSGESLYL